MEAVARTSFALALTPHGRLLLAPADEPGALEAAPAASLQSSFERGTGHGLLQLALDAVGAALPAALAFWRDFAVRYVTAVRTHTDVETAEIAPPGEAELETLAKNAPPMPGAEYHDAPLLASLGAGSTAHSDKS